MCVLCCRHDCRCPMNFQEDFYYYCYQKMSLNSMSLYFDVVIVYILQERFQNQGCTAFHIPKHTHVESDPSSNGHPKADASPKTNKRPFILKSLKSVLVCQVYVLHTIDTQQKTKSRKPFLLKKRQRNMSHGRRKKVEKRGEDLLCQYGIRTAPFSLLRAN